MVAAPVVTVVQVGTPGPPGAGITTAEKNALAPKTSPTFVGTVTIPTEVVTTETVTTLTVLGVATFNGNVNIGNETTDTINFTGHLNFLGSAPTSTVHANAGIGATSNILFGNDTRGCIRVVTGTNPVAGVLTTITCFTPRANANYVVILTAAESDAADLGGKLYVNQPSITANGFSLRTTATPPASQELLIYYWCIE